MAVSTLLPAIQYFNVVNLSILAFLFVGKYQTTNLYFAVLIMPLFVNLANITWKKKKWIPVDHGPSVMSMAEIY